MIASGWVSDMGRWAAGYPTGIPADRSLPGIDRGKRRGRKTPGDVFRDGGAGGVIRARRRGFGRARLPVDPVHKEGRTTHAVRRGFGRRSREVVIFVPVKALWK